METAARPANFIKIHRGKIEIFSLLSLSPVQHLLGFEYQEHAFSRMNINFYIMP